MILILFRARMEGWDYNNCYQLVFFSVCSIRDKVCHRSLHKYVYFVIFAYQPIKLYYQSLGR